MFEGAKSIRAGAATIALAGAAVGIGNVSSSLIHSVARNPSLAKQLMWEFAAPILVAFVISLLVSLILFGFSLFMHCLNFRPFPLLCIPLVMMFSFMFIFFFLIELNDSLPRNILILGGSSILFYICVFTFPKNFEKKVEIKETLLYVFFLSSFLSCFWNPFPIYGASIFTFLYILRFFFPINSIATLLLIFRAIFFPVWSFPLLMQASFLVLFLYILLSHKKRSPIIITLSIYISCIFSTLSGVHIIMDINWDALCQYFYCPISGGLTLLMIFLCLTEKSIFIFQKKLLFPFALYFINGFFISIMGGTIQEALRFTFYFISLFGFIMGLFFSKRVFHRNEIGGFSSSSFPLSLFFMLFLALMGILISDSYKGDWPDFYQYSIIQQICFFNIFTYIFDKTN